MMVLPVPGGATKKVDKSVPKFGSAKGMFVMHDDFDETLADCLGIYKTCEAYE